MTARRAEAHVDSGTLTLHAVFVSDATRADVRVSYELHNAGADAVAVFDRGDRQQVASGRLDAGTVPPPAFERGDGGELVLVHAARALPHPSPTLPPTPLAARLEPGAVLRGEFTATWPTGQPRRLRWCLGVAEFDAALFDQPQTLHGVSLWRASFAIVERQRRLCTPWLDMATGAFRD